MHTMDLSTELMYIYIDSVCQSCVRKHSNLVLMLIFYVFHETEIIKHLTGLEIFKPRTVVNLAL